jgi:anti-sigma factor RsiW
VGDEGSNLEIVSEQDELITRYLLGEMSGEDESRFESRYFDDDSLFEQLTAIEDELIHAYARGELAPRERSLFEARYLASERGRERIAFARELSRALAPEVTAEKQSARSSSEESAQTQLKVSWWRGLFNTSFASRSAAKLAFAVLLIALLVGGVWIVLRLRAPSSRVGEQARETRNGKLTEPGTTPEQRPPGSAAVVESPMPTASPIESVAAPSLGNSSSSERTAQSRKTQLSAVVSLVLSAAMTRGSGEASTLLVPQDARRIRLRAELPSVEKATYQASIQTVEGREVWSRKGLRAAKSGDRSVLTLELPASRLNPGDYILVLSRITKRGVEETGSSFYFKVKHR